LLLLLVPYIKSDLRLRKLSVIENSTEATATAALPADDAACGPEHGYKLIGYGLLMLAGAAMLHTGNMLLFGSYAVIATTVYLMNEPADSTE